MVLSIRLLCMESPMIHYPLPVPFPQGGSECQYSFGVENAVLQSENYKNKFYKPLELRSFD
eukprot:Gb_16643 [translate_table: standard]